MKGIQPDTLSLFAYDNGAVCPNPRGIVLDFHGLGGGGMQEEHDAYALLLAEYGGLLVRPYDNPWSWMNDVAVHTADAIVDAVRATYGLSAETPLISTGASMGGLSALVYPVYTKHRVTAVAANCPVCDLPYHYKERRDLPRTLYSAFGHYACGLEEALRSASPLHLAARFPHVPFYIAHGDADGAVAKSMHSDKLAAAMKELGYKLTYDEVPGMGHCALSGDALERYRGFILRALGGTT